jgi:hypothetical protein
MRLGVRLAQMGTPVLTWRDFAAMVKYADHTTAIYLAVNGHSWNIDTVLAVENRDIAMLQIWQKNRSAGGRMRRPKPFPRPKQLSGETTETKTVGKAADLDEIKRFLERKNGR